MKFISNKKGMSLAEIVVVLAVVAIVSTIVVSFSVLVHQKTAISNSKVDAVADIRVVENIIDGWIYRQVVLGHNISVEGDVVKSSGGYELTFSDNKILGTLPDGKNLWFNTSTIESIEYEIFDKDFPKYKCQLLLNFGNQKSFWELMFCEQAQGPPAC